MCDSLSDWIKTLAALVFLGALIFMVAQDGRPQGLYTPDGRGPVESIIVQVGESSWVVACVPVDASIDVPIPPEWSDHPDTLAAWIRIRGIGLMPISAAKRYIVGSEGMAEPPPEPRRVAEGPLDLLWRWWPIGKGQKRVATFAA